MLERTKQESSQGAAAPRPLTHAEVRTIFFGLMLGMFLAAINQTIVATALPTIGRDFNDFENLPWILNLVEYTKKAIQHNRVRVLGICFGHQIIGRALGVKVGRSDAGWEIAVCDVDLTEEGKKLFGREKLVCS